MNFPDKKFLRLFLLLLILGMLNNSIAGEVQSCDILFFYDRDCPDCEKTKRLVIEPISHKYPSRLVIHKLDITETENFEKLMLLEKNYHTPAITPPGLFTSYGAAYGKPEKIAGELEQLIQKEIKLKTPGPYKKIIDGCLKASLKTSPQALTPVFKKLEIYAFLKSGCISCNRLNSDLRYLNNKFPGRLLIKKMDINSPEAQIINQALCEKYQVAPESVRTAPSVFFSDQYFVGKNSFGNSRFIDTVKKLVSDSKYLPTPVVSEQDLKSARQHIFNFYNASSWFTVVAAGLLDGINPCAFTTIIFLLSYLALLKFHKKEIAFVGIAFVGSLFITYLAVGLGFFKFIQSISFLPYVVKGIYYLSIALAFIFGFLNLRDWLKIRKGSLKDMDLKLNDSLRSNINKVIREKLKIKHYILGALVIGFSVSILELACTGQVYLPTILFIIESQGISAQALLMLIIYNIAFILPLLLIFALFMAGSVSEKLLSKWLKDNGAWIKLGLGLIFIIMGFMMLRSL